MSSALCIALVLAGTVRPLPTDRLTLRWTHTVERTGWEEDYRAGAYGLVIDEARIERSGAGMEPPADATWADGWWHYRPSLAPLTSVILANSEFASGYSLCWA